MEGFKKGQVFLASVALIMFLETAPAAVMAVVNFIQLLLSGAKELSGKTLGAHLGGFLGGFGRFLLFLSLIMLMFKGYSWSRWLTAGLLLFTTILGFATAIPQLNMNPVAWILIMVINIYCVTVLAFSKSVTEYFRVSTQRRKPPATAADGQKHDAHVI
jgi:hypothetical protein